LSLDFEVVPGDLPRFYGVVTLYPVSAGIRTAKLLPFKDESGLVPGQWIWKPPVESLGPRKVQYSVKFSLKIHDNPCVEKSGDPVVLSMPVNPVFNSLLIKIAGAAGKKKMHYAMELVHYALFHASRGQGGAQFIQHSNDGWISKLTVDGKIGGSYPISTDLKYNDDLKSAAKFTPRGMVEIGPLGLNRGMPKLIDTIIHEAEHSRQRRRVTFKFPYDIVWWALCDPMIEAVAWSASAAFQPITGISDELAYDALWSESAQERMVLFYLWQRAVLSGFSRR
jgi:hypothetical protein